LEVVVLGNQIVVLSLKPRICELQLTNGSFQLLPLLLEALFRHKANLFRWGRRKVGTVMGLVELLLQVLVDAFEVPYLLLQDYDLFAHAVHFFFVLIKSDDGISVLHHRSLPHLFLAKPVQFFDEVVVVSYLQLGSI
jgi:hypothetical protein